MYTNADCIGWKCRIGGFFSNNQPFCTLFALGTNTISNTIGDPIYYNTELSTGRNDNGIQLHALCAFADGTSTNASNYKILTNDLNTKLKPCVPLITGINRSTTSITVYWNYIGVCNKYEILNDTTVLARIEEGVGIYDTTSLILLTNEIQQKYVTANIDTTVISQVGYNLYTVSGLSPNTTYNLYVKCYFYTVNTSGTPNQLSSNVSSLTTSVKSTTTSPAAPTVGTITSTYTTISVPFNAGTQGTAKTVTYYVYYSTSSISAESGTSFSSTTSPVSLTGLSSGTTYYLYIKATNDSGSTPATNPTSSIATISFIPTITSVSSRNTDSKLDVAYEAPSGATGTLYYYFYFTTDTSVPNYTTVLPDNGTSPETAAGKYTSGRLSMNTTYYVWAAISTQSTITASNKASLNSSNIGITATSTSKGTSKIGATGGTITFYGSKTIHTFTSNGKFTVVDNSITSLTAGIIGGGGAGGTSGAYGAGGGGGAGGVYELNPTFSLNTEYSIYVGSGGKILSDPNDFIGFIYDGADGDSSSAFGITCGGGGGGGDGGGGDDGGFYSSYFAYGRDGRSGENNGSQGSGGGGGFSSLFTIIYGNGGTGLTNGSSASRSSGWYSSGGGGGGGGSASNSTGGTYFTATCNNVKYAYGGNGSAYTSTTVVPGSGGQSNTAGSSGVVYIAY